MTEVDMDVIVKDAKSIAEALERYNVFGLERDHMTAQAKTFFVDMVIRQASLDIDEPLIIAIKETGASIEVTTKIWSGTALFETLKVTPLLGQNSSTPSQPIDYEALKMEIEFIRQ
jgi:hypothetical protein